MRRIGLWWRVAAASLAGAGGAGAAAQWPGFRGPGARGVVQAANPPLGWDAAAGRGIGWAAEVPLPGAGSPIVWENRIFLSGAAEQQAGVFCYDAATGALLWRADLPLRGRPDPYDESTTFAAPTPVTDGKRVFAMFVTGLVAAFDMDGKPAWTNDLGLPRLPYGYASSPALYADRLLVQYDQEKSGGALIALDVATGREAWRAARSMGASWSSPIIVETAKGPQVVLVSCGGVAAYDPRDGRELWTVRRSEHDISNTAVLAGGLVVATLGSAGTIAIRPDGAGDVTGSHVAWENEDAGAEVASAVALGDWVFVPSYSMMCLQRADGKTLGERELKGTLYASPVIAGGRIYIVNRTGDVTILRADPSLERLGTASFGEPVDATPAVSGDALIVRTHKRLFRVQSSPPAAGEQPKPQ